MYIRKSRIENAKRHSLPKRQLCRYFCVIHRVFATFSENVVYVYGVCVYRVCLRFYLSLRYAQTVSHSCSVVSSCGICDSSSCG